MVKERRDNKNRILRTGEHQRKDGRYEYKYRENGVTHSVYSYRLTENDKCTRGRKLTKSLREMEREIQDRIAKNLSYHDAYVSTLNDRVDLYLSTKTYLKQTTYENYKYMYNTFVRKNFGKKKLSEIHYSELLQFYLELINDGGLKINTLETIHNTIHPALKMAVRDGVIPSNPADGIIGEIKKTTGWVTPKRHSLTLDQQEKFLSFLDDNPQYKKWQRIFTLLLGTGCRIGELTGLCWDNIDFDNKIITIDHTLTYHKDLDGKCRLHISTPKTDAGVRKIPMFDDVQAVLNEILEEQKKTGVMIEFEGKSGFVLTNRYNSLYLPNSINKAFTRIIEDYNFKETLDAQNNSRKTELMPHFSAHNLRHTFCTRICENITNVSVIQEVMGHRDIHTTMDIYNEVQDRIVKHSFEDIEGCFRIR
ncbi:MAG: site-specific integrase [Ruminococcus sp.]|nr:site-specific integrase [Ruminococcus sp.]